MNTLSVIPARGGSQGLRRKNLLPDSDGVPLVLVAARAARDAGCTVVVSTDDPEVKSLAVLDGHRVHDRGPELADVPVDEVVEAAARSWAGHPSIQVGNILLVQPTVQPMTVDLLEWFIAMARTGEQPAALGVEDRHLSWHDNNLLTGRVERQQHASWPVREMGVRWWPALPLGPPARVIVAPSLLTDIDTADDYARIGQRLNILFAVKANHLVGSGHLHRALTLAEGLQHHRVDIALTRDSSHDARRILHNRGWGEDGGVTDVIVYDQLDTRVGMHLMPSVSLEDLSGHATVTVNAMYGDGDYVGPDYAVLRPEFLIGDYQVREDATRVLALFGGTDPAGLTAMAAEALPDLGIDLDVVRPSDERGVAAAMHEADLLLTSGGRTVFEAAAVGIPTIVLCQNMRELTHTHLGVGNLPMGLGRLVDPFHLRRTVRSVLDDHDLRLDLSVSARQSVDGRGADRIRRIIEHVGYYGSKP